MPMFVVQKMPGSKKKLCMPVPHGAVIQCREESELQISPDGQLACSKAMEGAIMLPIPADYARKHFGDLLKEYLA